MIVKNTHKFKCQSSTGDRSKICKVDPIKVHATTYVYRLNKRAPYKFNVDFSLHNAVQKPPRTMLLSRLWVCDKRGKVAQETNK